MGRKKIQIKKLTSNRLRTVSSKFCLTMKVTLHKRLKGLTKKAMEISLLTGVEINLTVYDPQESKLLWYLSANDVESKQYTPKFLNRYTNEQVSNFSLTLQYDYLFNNAPVPKDKIVQSEEESDYESEVQAEETGNKRQRRSKSKD